MFVAKQVKQDFKILINKDSSAPSHIFHNQHKTLNNLYIFYSRHPEMTQSLLFYLFSQIV